MRAILERYGALLQWLSGLGLPIAVVIVGWLATTSVETSKLNSEYVRIALGILSERDAGSKPPNLALRGWAIRLLDEKSPIPFSAAEKRALLQEGLPPTVAYGASGVLNGVGLLDFKKHVDNPTKNELRKALGTDAVSTDLLTLPTMTGYVDDPAMENSTR